MPPDPASPAPVAGPCNCQALRQAARRATAWYDAAMAPFGLRISQYALLHRLRGGPSTVQALAADLLLDRTTLGRNLRPLERDGLVSSQADPRDRRVRRLAATEKGAALAVAAMPAWQAAQARFEAAYGTVEAEALRRSLRRVNAALGSID